MTLDRDFLAGKRVTVLGLGIEGVDLVRFLVAHGADVTASDAKTGDRLQPALQRLEGLPVRYSLGANRPEDVASADLLFVSQSVPLDIPAVQEARRRGIPISSMTRLFMELCPAPIVGITGSSGKTTTTSLVGAMFAAAGRPHVVGGNIGVGLLDLLDRITPEMTVVLEISHTQLQLTDRSPQVACVLNVTPNHLDRFSWDEYRQLKRNILAYQGPGDIAVLNRDDAESSAMASLAKGAVWWFSARESIEGDGASIRDGVVTVRRGGVEEPVVAVNAIPLRGEHNVANVVAAAAVGAACGLPADAMGQAVRTFQPVPHRLEFVAEIDGVEYYNDSIATTPERTRAGMRSFEEPLVLLLGGREKHLPLDDLVRDALERCHAVILFGEAAPLLEAAFEARAAEVAYEERPAIRRVTTLEEAVRAARDEACPGDVVLLSPACTSFDAYDNFEQRGDHFRRLVRELAGREA
ncbi:MAG TPA: UDP-N-acetylmuramoyl-L-alanine--D-glutamate ligase [Dehalococcoidia bacterium]|nr:UDP-N-acetylmuramoyl-L-alanine--D-glutamate ligase [Dehalococcoidia bacterium]